MSNTPAEFDIVFYDGECGLCHRGIRFLARRARRGRLRFAPLGGATYAAAIPTGSRASLPDSMIVRRADGLLLTRYAAALQALRCLGGGWPWLATCLALVPSRLGNWAYDAVARRRQRWFDRPASSCPVLDPELRALFLE